MATMRDSDEILLKGLRDTVCADVSAADWDLVLKAVTDAGDVRNVRGMARTILFDAVEKASFASRSEAGRYAANQRWKGHVVQGAERLRAQQAANAAAANAANAARGAPQMAAPGAPPPPPPPSGGGVSGKVLADKMRGNPSLAVFADKVAQMPKITRQQLEDMVPDYVEGKHLGEVFRRAQGQEAANSRWKVGDKPTIDSKGNASPPFLDTTDIDPEGKLDKPSGGKVPLASPPSAKQLLDLEERATAKYERQGMTTSDAQGAASADSKRNYGATADELLEQMDRGEARRMLADREKGMSADRKAELGAKFPKAGMVVDIPSKPRTAEESARIQANFEIARAASKKKKKEPEYTYYDRFGRPPTMPALNRYDDRYDE